ncbi:MAG TPA: hypothetical protein VHC22_05080 [Pirellulales bacterium]|nr:hypothetical protein [Pirellulales bacterium]
MTGIIVCLSAAVIGVDYGWQPVAGGGIEYIIQIEPELLDSLKSGQDLFSDLPASMRNIRSYRITVGKGRLPHHGEPPPNSTVVRAGGTSPADESTEAANPADIDLSQLPGPLVGPTLILPDERNAADENEPPHIAEAEAEPLRNRVAGYHAADQHKSAAGRATGEHETSTNASTDKEKTERVSSSANKRKKPTQDDESPSEKGEEKHLAHASDPESPSDRAPEKPAGSTVKSALVSLGLLTSLGCNAFLIWVAAGERRRYRALVRRMFGHIGDNTASSATPVPLPRWEPYPSVEKAGATGSPDSPGE